MLKIYGLNVDTLKNINTDTMLLNFAYAHYRLERENGFDLIGMNKYYMRKFEKYKPDGIYDVRFYYHDCKTPVKANMYWWHDKYGLRHGLVCHKADIEGNADALKKYMDKVCHL